MKDYYRIRITEDNGSTGYRRVIASETARSGFEVRAITHDRDDVILHLNVSRDQVVELKIITADGILVYCQTKIITAGTDWFRLQLKSPLKGMYMLQAYTSEELIRRKFIR